MFRNWHFQVAKVQIKCEKMSYPCSLHSSYFSGSLCKIRKKTVSNTLAEYSTLPPFPVFLYTNMQRGNQLKSSGFPPNSFQMASHIEREKKGKKKFKRVSDTHNQSDHLAILLGNTGCTCSMFWFPSMQVQVTPMAFALLPFSLLPQTEPKSCLFFLRQPKQASIVNSCDILNYIFITMARVGVGGKWSSGPLVMVS